MGKKQDWKRITQKSLDNDYEEEIPTKEVFKNRAKKKTVKKRSTLDRE